MLAWLLVSLDLVGSSFVKIEYLFDDLKGSTDDCFFTATLLQNPTQFSPTFPPIPYRCYTRMLRL